MPGKPWFKRVGAWILVPIWAWRTPVKPLPGGPRPSIQPGDNLQSMMNLIMQLKKENKSPIGRAKAALAIAENKDQIFAGLDNVGTVHFARFVQIGDQVMLIAGTLAWKSEMTLQGKVGEVIERRDDGRITVRFDCRREDRSASTKRGNETRSLSFMSALGVNSGTRQRSS